MKNEGFLEFLTVLIGAIISVATISVILSSSAQTSSVIQSFASGLSSLLQVAVSPITGTNSST